MDLSILTQKVMAMGEDVAFMKGQMVFISKFIWLIFANILVTAGHWAWSRKNGNGK